MGAVAIHSPNPPYSLAETFDVGRDTGTQVSKLYGDPFPFSGALDRVAITLTD